MTWERNFQKVSESNCEDEEWKKFFIRHKNNLFLVDDANGKRKKRFEKYMFIIRYWCSNDFNPEKDGIEHKRFEWFKNAVKLFEKLREQIATFIR